MKIDIHTSFVYVLFPFLILAGYVLVFYLNLPYAIVFLVYGVIPKLDQILQKDWDNPKLEELEKLENNQKFRLALYVALVFDWIVFFKTMSVMKNGQIGTLQLIPVTFMLINLSATGFLVSHELFHKLNWTDRLFGSIHQIKNLYIHFTFQHLYGHHKKVATDDDPASAIQGITLYNFLPKTIAGGLLGAFKINPLLVTLSLIAQILFVYGVYRYYGVFCMFYFLLMASGGIFILQLINYIEHYGLRRNRLPDGTYQKVNIRHSWNAPHRISNYLFFKLQRHSDHHQNSYKPYQILCSYEDSPMLPHGYLVCLLIACFPRYWFDMMDPLVREYRKEGKGTNLKALQIAQSKAQLFTDRLYGVTALLMLGEILIKYGI